MVKRPARAPAAHDAHLAHPAALQGAERGARDVGAAQFVRAARQDAGHVDRHVAHADHDRRARLQRVPGEQSAPTSGWALYQETKRVAE
ncbi:hypothetical protein SCALM49S_02092 [Streptomyces californicus]